jgi:hypothetical protein
MNSDVEDLLKYIESQNRKGFYVPTEGFDTTLIHTTKTCFDKNESFAKDVSQILQDNPNDEVARTAFSMEVKQPHVLLKVIYFQLRYLLKFFNLMHLLKKAKEFGLRSEK